MTKNIDFAEIDKDVSSKNFFDLLEKYDIEACRPYIKSLADKRNYMLLSHDLFVNTVESLRKRVQETSAKKIEELNRSGYCSFGSSDTKQWNTLIDGYEIGFQDMLRKTAWDFFHYARLTIDMYLQIINVSILDKPYPDEEVRFSKLKSSIEPYKDMVSFLEDNEKNTEYKYILSFDNYMKHINEVPIDVKMNSSGLFDFTEMALEEVYIHSFSYKEQNYEMVKATDKISSARDYTVKTTSRFLRILLAEQTRRMEGR